MDYLHDCATKIQKVFRGYMTRQLYQQLQQILYYSHQTSQSQVVYTTNQSFKQSQKSKSSKGRPILFEFDIYINAALMIQKTFRGFLARKWVFNYYKIKWAVRILEQRMYEFYRRVRESFKYIQRLHQRKIVLKQLQTYSYSIQNQCRTIQKIKLEVLKQSTKNRKLQNIQQSLDQTDQILYDAFLSLFSKDYSRQSNNQKFEYQRKLKQFISSSQIAKENYTPNVRQNSQITTQQFCQILMSQAKRNNP